MKALVKCHPGRNGLKVKDMPEPITKEGELKVKVIAAGICGTDIHIMLDEYPYNSPVILGHEYVGEVVEVGKGVRGFNLGDKVVSLTAAKTCGHCLYCRNDLLMLCEERLSIGSGLHGAFAEYMTIPARLAFLVSKEFPDIGSLALCEPLACACRGLIERTIIKKGDLVLVSGPGTIGLLALQVAKTRGGRVIVIGTDQDKERLHIARQLGAEYALDSDVELFDLIKSLSNYGVDVAVECAGVAPSADICLRSLRKHGSYTQVGLFGKNILFNMDLAVCKELTISNNFASEPSSWKIALDLLKHKQLNLNPWFRKSYLSINGKMPLIRQCTKKGLKFYLNPEPGLFYSHLPKGGLQAFWP